ncbi:MAG: 23S rRNA (guanosine(2251)-2'-O)-methyltransferase RlmB [bacterium]|nr:23S rRNA (guanosine(2251)-2'-O)-methyltransferase RlmB [bacterium]
MAGAKGNRQSKGPVGARGRNAGQTRGRNGNQGGRGVRGDSNKQGGYRGKQGASFRQGSASRDDKRTNDRRDSKPTPDIIVGRRAVLEAMETDVPLKKVMIAQGSQAGDALDQISARAEKQGIKLEYVSRKVIETKAPGLNHQGVIAMSRPFDYSTIEEIIGSCSGKDAALVYVLDHITDVGNLGAIIRSAEVLGAAGVVIPNRRSVQITAGAYKSSAGALLRVPVAQVSNIAQACARLQRNGFWVVGCSEKATESCWDAELAGKVALVMGNEGDGLSRVVTESCDMLVKLPQRGEIGSLNVSCAAVSMGYEWLRQSVAASMVDLDASSDE